MVDYNVTVIKKDGTTEPFNPEKIINAVEKSSYRALSPLSDEDKENILKYVTDYIITYNREEITVPQLHNLVESALESTRPEVAKCYRDYRNYKTDFVEMINNVYKKAQSIMYIGDKENSNTDSALVSTKRSLIFNQMNKELYQKFFMTTEELQACRDGYIYVHDMSARRDTMNCSDFDIEAVLTGGFEMGNIWYNEPTTLDSAFDVIGDIVLSAASQQYGGFTIPEVDKILAPYAQKSYDKHYDKIIGKLTEDGEAITDKIRHKAHKWAMEEVQNEYNQGYQGWEYKFNTVSSSRGDYPFIAITFGLGTSKFEKMCSKTILRTRREGQGKKDRKIPVLFPKLIFLYTEDLHGVGKENEDVFEEGAITSSKTMYPDWLSLDGPTHVAEAYHKYGKVISPMGCVDRHETVTYKFNNQLYVESISRMWDRLTTVFKPRPQQDNSPHMIIDVEGVEIYDSKKGFVKTKHMVRNVSSNWMNLKLTNGRSILCTTDHPFPVIDKGRTYAGDLNIGDKIPVVKTQYSEETIDINPELAWAYGVLLCDGCYDSSVVVSIAMTGEDEIAYKLDKVLEKEYDTLMITKNQIRGKKGIYKDLQFKNASVLRHTLIEKFGGIRKKERHIPNEVFSYSRNGKLAFLAGMIDADGYINSSDHGISVVQLGSTNKELALQQMMLMQSLGLRAKIYQNRYSKKTNKIRYRVECDVTYELAAFVQCAKKQNHVACVDRHNSSISLQDYGEVKSIELLDDYIDYSYDVTTESDHFDVSGIYSHNCRAFLSPWYIRGGMTPADEFDEPVYVGRFNIGAVSLHLPLILAKARQENKDFYEVLDYYLELIRQLHIRTYAYLGELKASCNPLAYCEGGFFDPTTGKPAHLNPGDKIKPLLKCATASFGITAFNELQRLYNGKSLVEDGKFALEVLTYINDKVNKFKYEDGNLYAIYGTPAENLCGLQVKQFRNKHGIIDGVSDKEYVSNSFHCHVSEDITPIQKQDLEYRFWNLSSGGRINYVKYPIDYNIKAIKTLVRRAMSMGLYEGVNMSLAYCNDCGHQELEMDICPKCGSHNLTKIDRMNGYLSYSRVHGDTRLNDAKMAEISDRKSM